MGEQHSISAYQKEIEAARFSFFHFVIKALLGIIGRMSVPNAQDRRLRIILFRIHLKEIESVKDPEI